MSRLSRSGHGRHAAVVSEPAPVEHDGADAGRLRPLGHQPPDRGGGRDVAGATGAADLALEARCGGQGAPAAVVDDLGDHVAVGSEHGQAGALGRPRDRLAHAVVPAQPRRPLRLR
jgi:hypothetical protein